MHLMYTYVELNSNIYLQYVFSFYIIIITSNIISGFLLLKKKHLLLSIEKP